MAFTLNYRDVVSMFGLEPKKKGESEAGPYILFIGWQPLVEDMAHLTRLYGVFSITCEPSVLSLMDTCEADFAVIAKNAVFEEQTKTDLWRVLKEQSKVILLGNFEPIEKSRLESLGLQKITDRRLGHLNYLSSTLRKDLAEHFRK